MFFVWILGKPYSTVFSFFPHYPIARAFDLLFSSHVRMWELDYKETWAPKNGCFWTVMLEKTLESPLECKEIQPVHPKGNVMNVHWKDWCWNWNSNTLSTWCEELTHLKRSWCWERSKEGGERDDREWGGWMASPTRWTWVWASLGSWWWTEKPGMQSMGWKRVSHDWVTEWNWIDILFIWTNALTIHQKSV